VRVDRSWPWTHQPLPGLHGRPASRPSGGLRKPLGLHGASTPS
jgi:hypothetical protein